MLRPFLQMLNRETDAGHMALQTLRTTPVARWPQYFASRPGWRSYGVFRAMLSYARELFDGDPRLAFAVTTFVTGEITSLESVPESVVLAAYIHGLAWKEHANALYALANYAEAADAAARAIRVFSDASALSVDVASATLIRAMSLHNLGNTREALELIMTSVRLFAANAQPRGYLVSLQVCGGILADLDEYAAARDAYRVALKIAEEQNDQREVARLFNNIGQCSVRLNDVELGEQQLQQAFRLFNKEQMHSEMLRAVAGLARAQYKRGALVSAISAFHSVYADLLHYEMLIPAAQVLVELTDIVTELTGDVAYAHDEGARLAETFGDYDVPGNVREAMAFVQRETAAARSVAQVRAALGHARSFLEGFWSSPSAAFAVPA